MTTNQTIDGVPRELKLCPRCANNGRSDDCPECHGRVAWYDKPPSEAFTEWYCRNPYEDLSNSTTAWMAFKAGRDHASAAAQKPAAQPQGEPVAWQYRVSAGPQTGWSLWHDGKGEEFKQSYQVETRPLYAEQPAPVAVVLPERKHHVHQGLSHTDAKADGWNACIDEVNRLNTPQ